jgi:hypothetical protein
MSNTDTKNADELGWITPGEACQCTTTPAPPSVGVRNGMAARPLVPYPVGAGFDGCVEALAAASLAWRTHHRNGTESILVPRY